MSQNADGAAGDDATPELDDDAVAGLERAAEALRERRASVADLDCDPAEVASVYEDLVGVADAYRDRATDWDDFEGYVEFRDEFADVVDEVPPDFPYRDEIEAADEALKTGARSALSESDFEAAHDHLDRLREVADARSALLDARDFYRDARRRVRNERDDAADRVEELERLQRLGQVDLSAPVEELRDPIEAHDEAVREAIRELKRATPARDALSVLDVAAVSYPLVPVESPPEELLAYLRDDDEAGDVSVSTLLEYCEYSRSKLAHHVADADGFRTAVATNRTYLRRLDAEPFVVGWPPPTAGRLRYRARELVAVEGRFAPESTVATARQLKRLAGREDYDRLRDAAVARAELDDDERARVRDGDVADDLESARRRRDALDDVLAEYPPLSDWPAPGADAVEP